jgi:hypothetical protein
MATDRSIISTNSTLRAILPELSGGRTSTGTPAAGGAAQTVGCGTDGTLAEVFE